MKCGGLHSHRARHQHGWEHQQEFVSASSIVASIDHLKPTGDSDKRILTSGRCLGQF